MRTEDVHGHKRTYCGYLSCNLSIDCVVQSVTCLFINEREIQTLSLQFRLVVFSLTYKELIDKLLVVVHRSYSTC